MRGGWLVLVAFFTSVAGISICPVSNFHAFREASRDECSVIRVARSFNFTSEVSLTHPVVIEGDGHPTLDAGFTNRFLTIRHTNVTLINVAFANGYGYAGGALSTVAGQLQLINVTFHANSAEYGAAIHSNSSELKIDTSFFTSNSANYAGGAIYTENSVLQMNNSSFSNCKAVTFWSAWYYYYGYFSGYSDEGGGALHFSTSDARIVGSNFTSCTGGSEGGAIVFTQGALSIDSSVFVSCSLAHSSGLGGVISVNEDTSCQGCNGTSVSVRNVAFTGTSIWNGRGGAIHMQGSDSSGGLALTVSDSTFHSLSTGAGGAIYANGGSYNSGQITVKNSLFKDITVRNNGAGLYTYYVNVTIISNSFVDMLSEYYSAAGIYARLYGGSVALIHNSSFENLKALTSTGGAVAIEDGSATITSSKFKASSGLMGGALAHEQIYSLELLTVDITDSTFDDCFASVEGGSVYINSPQARVSNTAFRTSRAPLGAGVSFTPSEGSMMVIDSLFQNNNATTSGGGIHGSGTGTIDIWNTRFEATAATVNGGAIALDSSSATLIVNRSAFDRAISTTGGAISSVGNLSVHDSSFYRCRAFSQGGALQVSGPTHVSNGTFLENYVKPVESTLNCITIYLISYWGDGWHGIELTLQSTTPGDPSFSGITATGYTESVEVCLPVGSTYNVSSSYCTDWLAGYYSWCVGVAGWTIGDGLAWGTVEDFDQFIVPAISDDDRSCASSGGGAIHVSDPATVTIESGTFFRNNSAFWSFGGGMFVSSSSTVDKSVVRIRDTTFGPNFADYYGSSVYASLSDITCINTAFSNLSKSELGCTFSSGASFLCSSSCPRASFGQCQPTEDKNCWSCTFDACTPCPPGKYGTDAGATTESSGCHLCPEGKFSSKPGSSTCSVCQAGSYAVKNMSTSTGFGDTIGALGCAACPRGRFAEAEASSQCETCDQGFSSIANSSKCFKCPRGQFASDKGSEICHDCPNGFAAPRNGSHECEECISPSASGPGSPMCDRCIEGFYFDDGSGGCLTCPENGICRTWSTLRTVHAKEGFWRRSGLSDEIEECPGFSAACTGGAINTSITDQCTPFGFGPFCALCETRKYRTMAFEECKDCPTAKNFFDRLPFQTYVALGVILLVMGMVIHHVRKFGISEDFDEFEEARECYDCLKTKFKIAWTSLQIASQFPISFEVAFPKFIQKAADALGILNVDLFSVIPTLCMVAQRKNLYYRTLLTYTLLPIGVCFLILGIYGHKRRFAASDKARLRLNIDYMTIVLVFSFTIFVAVSSCIFGFFAYDYLDDGSCYLRRDYGTRCDSHMYEYYSIFATIMILVFPVGIPAVYLVLLWRARDDIDPIIDEATGERGRMDDSIESVERAIAIRNHKQDSHHLHFICASYEPQFWWWEVFECFRRLLLTSANVFIAHAGVMMQLVINLCFALFSLKLYSYYEPFVADTDDVLSEVAQWLLVFSLLMTLMIHEGIGANEDGTMNSTGIAFVSMQLTFVLFAIGVSIADMRQEMAFAKSKLATTMKRNSVAAKTARRRSSIVSFRFSQLSLAEKRETRKAAILIQAAGRGYIVRSRGLGANGRRTLEDPAIEEVTIEEVTGLTPFFPQGGLFALAGPNNNTGLEIELTESCFPASSAV